MINLVFCNVSTVNICTLRDEQIFMRIPPATGCDHHINHLTMRAIQSYDNVMNNLNNILQRIFFRKRQYLHAMRYKLHWVQLKLISFTYVNTTGEMSQSNEGKHLLDFVSSGGHG